MQAICITRRWSYPLKGDCNMHIAQCASHQKWACSMQCTPPCDRPVELSCGDDWPPLSQSSKNGSLGCSNPTFPPFTLVWCPSLYVDLAGKKLLVSAVWSNNVSREFQIFRRNSITQSASLKLRMFSALVSTVHTYLVKCRETESRNIYKIK